MNTYSQAAQDLFVRAITKYKMNGFFVDIGSNHHQVNSNTYILEKKYNWSGLLVDYDASFRTLYDTHRSKSIYVIDDARKIDYKNILDNNNFPKHIDYLQIDLDVDNKSTLDTFLLLNDTIFDTYKFATITFEHDIYTGNYFDTQSISRKILRDRGYILVFPNVSLFWAGSFKPFEDWYVHPDLVDMNIVNKVLTTKSLNTNEITAILSTI